MDYIDLYLCHSDQAAAAAASLAMMLGIALGPIWIFDASDAADADTAADADAWSEWALKWRYQ